MRRYLLDTNMVSLAIRRHDAVLRRLTTVPTTSVCISAITEGELLFGLAQRPGATRLRAAVEEFLLRVDVLAWERSSAASYGELRASMNTSGKSLSPLDLLIAAQAKAIDAVLVSNDQAFSQCPGLTMQDWSR